MKHDTRPPFLRPVEVSPLRAFALALPPLPPAPPGARVSPLRTLAERIGTPPR